MKSRLFPTPAPRFFALPVLLVAASVAAQPTLTPPGIGGLSGGPVGGQAGMQTMIVTGGLVGGKNYSVAEHCGASAELLKAYKARFDADTHGGEQLYAQLGINIEAVFRQGRKDGDAFYDSIKSTPERTNICSRTLAHVEKKAGGG